MTSRIALFTLLALLVTGCGSVDPLASYRTDLTRKKLDDLPQITVANLDFDLSSFSGAAYLTASRPHCGRGRPASLASSELPGSMP